MGYPLGHPQRTGRKPYFQMEHKAMNFQASWWGHFQRLTDDQWGTAGCFQEWHLSLEMQTDNRKLSFWKASYQTTYVELKSGKSPPQQEVRGLTPGKKRLETLESNLDSLKSPIKSMGTSARWQAGFCLNAEMPLQEEKEGWPNGWRHWEVDKSSFSAPSLKNCLFFLIFAGDICQLPHYSSITPLHGPERLCKQGMLLLCSSAPVCLRIVSSVAGLLTPLMLMQDAELKVETGSPWMTHIPSKLWGVVRWLQHQTKAHKTFSFRSIPAEYTWE